MGISLSTPNSSTGPTTIPTGTVSVSIDGVVVNPSLALAMQASSGTAIAAYTFVAPATAGSHLLQVAYAGDGTHTPAQNTFALLVGDVVASGSLGLSAANLTLTTNGTGTSAVVVTPAAGYHGRVLWSLSATGGATGQIICYGINSVEVNAIGTTPATLYLAAGTACSTTSSAHQPALRAVTHLPARALLQGEPGREAHPSAPKDSRRAPGIVLSAGMLLCGALWRRRRHPLLLTLVLGVLAAFSSTLIGCGGSSGNNSTPTPTPAPAPTPFTLTLTGQDSVNNSIMASTSLILTVN